jgi:hypothetical protein
MSGLVNVEGLNRASQKYQPVLQMLPFLVLQNVMSELEINLLEVSSKDIAVQMLRKGGVSAPYIATTSDDDHITSEELGKFVERILTVEPCVAVIKDHIMNYKDKLILNNDPNSQKVDNKTKKHPLEFLFLQEKVKTIAEDIIDALFFAERNTADKSPMGMFNGYNTILDSLVSAGEISTAKKNLVNTGSIETPADVDDTDAYDKLVAFLRSANPFLRKNGVLYATNDLLFNVMDALGNKIRYKGSLEYEIFLSHLKGTTQMPNLRIITHAALCSGDRLILCKPRNFDFGMNTKGDEQFVQVRNPYADPNFIQFWTQWDAGTRIMALHPKEFQINDGVNVGLTMSGDYIS